MFFRDNKDELITLTFIDGDEYEQKNNVRQIFRGYGNKAEVKAKELQEEFGDRLNFQIFPEFINSENANRLIVDGDVVFSCVDNHKTRKVISDHCSKLNNCVLISGGNEYTDGNIQTYVRKDGENLAPTIDQYHPEIEFPKDKSPEDLSCEELVEVGTPQLFFMNMLVSVYMCASFYNVIETHKIHPEVYVDLVKMESASRMRCI
jgi:molybdopterin/thiamine biosynthesis adenylyltransferase